MNWGENSFQDNKKRFSIGVIHRILKVLAEHNSEKITNLAMSSGLNYQTCKNYISLMSSLSWVDIRQDEKYRVIFLNDSGREILRKLNSIKTE